MMDIWGGKSKSGVTLIELVVTVTIILTISVMGSVFYSRFLTQNSVSTTVDRIVQSLRKAQTYAMESRKSNTVGWGVNYTAPTITLYQGNTFGTKTPGLSETFTVPSAVTVTAFDINFARMTGIPTPAASTITVRGLSTLKSITVNSQGMVTRN